MELKVLKTKCNLELPSQLDAYQAIELKEVLLKALEAEKPIVINAKKTERINSTCAQLLLAVKLEAQKNNNFSIEKISESVFQQLELIGLTEALELGVVS